MKVSRRYRSAISQGYPTLYNTVAARTDTFSLSGMFDKARAIQSRKRPVTSTLAGHPPGVIRHRCHVTETSAAKKARIRMGKPALITDRDQANTLSK